MGSALRRVQRFIEQGTTGTAQDLSRQLATFEGNAAQAVDELTAAKLTRFQVLAREEKRDDRIVAPGQALGISPSVTRVTLAKLQPGDSGKLTAIYKASLETASSPTIISAPAAINGQDIFFFSAPGLLLLVNDGVNYFTTETRRLFDVTLFGAHPTRSATQNNTAFQAALDAAELAGGGIVFVPRGRYLLSAELTGVTGVSIRGEGDCSVLDYSGVSSTLIGIAFRGSQATGVALAADAAEGSADLDVASTGFATDDWVKVYSSAVTGSTNLPKGEICRLSDAAAMTLYDPLCDSYATADSASVAKLTLLEGNTFADFKIVGPADNTVTFSGILVDYTLGARFENITTERCHFYGIAIQDSVDWTVSGCHFGKSETGALAYGVAIFNAAQDGTIACCRGYRLRHVVTHGGFTTRNGVPRRTTTSTCTGSQCRNSAFDAHAGGEDIEFTGCVSMGSESDGFTIECVSAVLTNCIVRDSVGPGFHLNPQSLKPYRVSLSNCEVSGKGNAASRSAIQIQVQTGYESFEGITITGGSFSDCRYGLRTINAETGRIENLSISGASFKQCGLDGDAVIGIVHAHNVSVTGCTINDATDSVDGISLTDVTHFSVGRNALQLTGSGGCRGVRCLTTCDDGAIGGNEVDTGASGIGIGIADTCTNITIGNDNHLRGCPTPLSLGTGAGHRLGQVEESSADRGDAAVTLLHYSEKYQRFNTPLTANRAVTLPSANVKMAFQVHRGAGATGAFNLTVAGRNLAAAGEWVKVVSDGSNFVIVDGTGGAG
ncbi:MAG TPA: right-handed parallel beta-helix repeat-containing protein [Polyangiaceae bacterium]|nr:right-handed parallel beta-helix repeat-containing protein [Polyangiaceae bacterium]